MKKFIKCFSDDKYSQLLQAGYTFLYERNGVWYFNDDDKLNVNFSSSDVLKDTKLSQWINL